MQEHKVEAGLQQLRRSVAIWQEFSDAYYLLGTVALKKQAWEDALNYFQAMQKISPQDLQAREGIALIELGKGMHLHIEGKLPQALEHFEKYIIMTPHESERQTVKKRVQNLRETIGKEKGEKQ